MCSYACLVVLMHVLLLLHLFYGPVDGLSGESAT